MTPGPAVVVLGPSARATAGRIVQHLPTATIHAPRHRLADLAPSIPFDDVAEAFRDLYRAGRPIVALCAAGIVIRALAPVLEDKRREPPVVAVAEDGSVVVPLLGGHRGANRLAQDLAAALDGVAAITTAGEVRLGMALDDPPEGWVTRNPDAAKAVTAALLADAPVVLRSDGDAPDWVAARARFTDVGSLQLRLTTDDDGGSDTRLVIHPQSLALGVGCERGTDPDELVRLVEATLEQHRVARAAIACVGSLDLKADEPAVHVVGQALGVPVRFFGPAQLEAETPRLANPSAIVFAATGCHGVSEGAALAAVGPDGTLIVPKTKSRRATCALARAPVPLRPDRVGRPQGQLAVVGIGPGSVDHRTIEAGAALAAAEHLVGYHGYLDQIETRPGAQVTRHAYELGEEEDRVRQALALAAEGQRVALVSSGDPGIYAMAALVFELLERTDQPAWHRIAVTVCPGVSALQAAAARAGAPLGHDFCAISLSDLLTPWIEIEARLEAAAHGDFVTVLFNPASKRRRRGLIQALAILGKARPADTPVILGRNLTRPGEMVTVAALAEFDPAQVDMLSIVIIGSSRTRRLPRTQGPPLVYTPRGYQCAG